MQQAIELISNGLTLRGMLHKPENCGGKIPVVCMFHGFTGNKTEAHFFFVKLSRILEQAGIASIRFDFGGSGESDGEFLDMTISKELEDAKNILAYAKSLDFADTDRIGILGMSMGGAIAGLLAGDCPLDIRTLCLWAPARNMRQIYLSRNNLKSDFRELTEKQRIEMHAKGYRVFSGNALKTDYLKDVESYDFAGRAGVYDKNVLILHGDSDVVVPIENSDVYLKVFDGRARLHVIKGADHTFSNVEWESELLQTTLDYFTRELLN